MAPPPHDPPHAASLPSQQPEPAPTIEQQEAPPSEGAQTRPQTIEIEHDVSVTAEEKPDDYPLQEAEAPLIPSEQPAIQRSRVDPDNVVLSFDNAELHKVVKMLSDILAINYLIDPKVKGTVNLHMKGTVAKTDLHALLDDIVRINRAVIIKNGSMHHIVPMTATPRTTLPIVSHPYHAGGQDPKRSGVAIHLAPLRYISPTELEKVIKPFLSPGSHIATYDKSRLLLFTEFADNVQTIRSLIELFDTNVFEQVTVRLYPIRQADVRDITQELEKIFGALELQTKSGTGVGINLVPIPRTNILLVISAIPESFELVEHWIEQLDNETGGTEVQTYIYHVKNGIAEELGRDPQQHFRKEWLGRCSCENGRADCTIATITFAGNSSRTDG